MKTKRSFIVLHLFLLLFVLISFYSSTFNVTSLEGKSVNASGSEVNTATYVGIAKYYDNRKSVVTSSHDDLEGNTSAWESLFSMLTRKKIYHSVGVITNSADWKYVQYWLNQGYTEAASHSRNHVHPPYEGKEDGKLKVSYEWQINGSKQDIIGNLTLPSLWRSGEREYVYLWIEPYGQSDQTVRRWLSISHYLSDRSISRPVYDFASWGPNNALFNRIGYTVQMGEWGETSVSSLDTKFDKAYNEGKIYHFMAHPAVVNWSKGAYADKHTDYISNRNDVWYVPLGLLYLYHWVDVRNNTQVAVMEHGNFKISISRTDHETYGVSYPITYVFNIPSNWTSGYVYYRYRNEDPWILMPDKSSEDFFNGISASRFNFSEHRAYVSVAFTSVSDNIYLQIRPSPFGVKPPTAVNASISNIRKTSLELTWTANADPNFARYEVYQSSSAGLRGTLIADLTGNATTSLNVTGLSPSTTYYFRVRVWDVVGLHVDSVQVNATTLAPPAAVAVSVSNITENSLNLTWTQSADAYFARYEVFQSSTSGVLGASIANVANKTNTSLPVSSLPSGTTCYYTIRVYDAEDLYADSIQQSATTLVPLWQQPWFIGFIVAFIVIVIIPIMLTGGEGEPTSLTLSPTR